MPDELSKQVEVPVVDVELQALKRKIDAMQILYVILFGISLVMIVYNYSAHSAASMHVIWAIALGSAVLTRIIRQSMVTKYNARLNNGRPAPLS